MLAAPRSESVRKVKKIFLLDRTQYRDDDLLHNLVLKRGNPQRSLTAIRFGYVNPPRRRCLQCSDLDHPVQLVHPLRKDLLVLPPYYSVHASRRVLLEPVKAVHK